ncbi:MAG: hypothetical protein IIV92_07900, partial [Schwartzia sp.]|nr:hypothetical protein [Schwartzia sp. (in: firmicutes)]
CKNEVQISNNREHNHIAPGAAGIKYPPQTVNGSKTDSRLQKFFKLSGIITKNMKMPHSDVQKQEENTAENSSCGIIVSQNYSPFLIYLQY